jgi:two-component system, chemotaxis family, sensor kinase CheA
VLDARSGAPGLRGKRVLLVEDSDTTRLVTQLYLEEAGCVVVSACNGVEAWGRLQDQTVDVILTDVNMPGMDGFALTRAVRGSPRLRHLPVIILSGLYTAEEKTRSAEVGANAYLGKGDTDSTRLAETIGEVLFPRR